MSHTERMKLHPHRHYPKCRIEPGALEVWDSPQYSTIDNFWSNFTDLLPHRVPDYPERSDRFQDPPKGLADLPEGSLALWMILQNLWHACFPILQIASRKHYCSITVIAWTVFKVHIWTWMDQVSDAFRFIGNILLKSSVHRTISPSRQLAFSTVLGKFLAQFWSVLAAICAK